MKNLGSPVWVKRQRSIILFLSILSFHSLPLVLAPKVFAKDTHSASTHEAAPGVPSDKALGWLKNGNSRYLTNKLRKDGQAASDIERLSKGQSPHTMVLSCSDSRVPPEVVFDQKLGEIFVVRTAGQALDNSGIASLEYAASHLGPQLLVVMGHTSCGAVKAALSTLDGSDAGSTALNALVKDIHPRVAKYKGKTQSSGVRAEAWSNVDGVAQDLEKRSELLKDLVSKGKVKIVRALYDLDSGKVEFKE